MKSAILFLLALVPAVVAAVEEAKPAVHIFGIYCDAYPGEAGAINEGVRSDRLLVNDLFRQHISEQGWGVRLVITEVMGEAATRKGILEKFDTCIKQLGSDDSLYVHFSGHGVIDDEETNEQMLISCDLERIDRSSLAKRMEEANCRLRVLITDCCSSFSRVPVAEGDEVVQPWRTLYGLLRNHRGFVNITAASPGEEALATNVGGYLTVNLHSDMQRYSTWRQVFLATKARVIEETTGKLGPGRVQTPMAYSLGKVVAPAGEGVPVFVEQIIPDSSSRRLSREELQSMGILQLYLARNEIPARHGHDFRTPLLNRYFGSLSWYEAKPGERDHPLNPVEDHNAQLIAEVEREMGGPFIGNIDSLPKDLEGLKKAPDIFTYSSRQVLSRATVESLSLRHLSLARNEIFARHGYPFRNKTLQGYFSRKEGYERNEAAVDPEFNEIERQNIWLIEKIERIKGGPHRW